MKRHYIALFTMGLLVLVGCNDTKSPPGGPGATGSNQRSTALRVGAPENTFQLDLPNLETTLKQGETKTITIGIMRGKNFDQDVKVEFSEPPKGVKVTAAHSTVKASDKDVQVTIEAAPDAALGEHAITVSGTPAREGAKTSAQFKIDVKKGS
jgi:uncharacterized membrane protein